MGCRYQQALSRRGLHKTALEVCKLLLALNPGDPMGALFAIDYLAGGAPCWQGRGWSSMSHPGFYKLTTVICEAYKAPQALNLLHVPNPGGPLSASSAYLWL